MKLTDADRIELDRWWEQSLRRRGLPDDVEPVQTRLIREVGRAHLPDAGEAWLKVMGFPRGRDRLRYLLRALPCHHEARVLRLLDRAGIPCPRVLDVRGRRRFGVPRFSFLVLAGLDRRGGEPDSAAVAALAGQLCSAGVFHPDLHAGNCIPLRDGRLAILDLHSARIGRPGLNEGQRTRMATRLIGECPALADDPAPLLRAGLLRAEQADAARERARRFEQRQLEGRILRCWKESTQFHRRRAWNGVFYQRRGPLDGGTWVSGGAELLRWWIGDRALEVLQQRPPVLRALFHRAPWLPGRHAVYIGHPLQRAELTQMASTLLEGYAAFRRIRQGSTESS